MICNLEEGLKINPDLINQRNCGLISSKNNFSDNNFSGFNSENNRFFKSQEFSHPQDNYKFNRYFAQNINPLLNQINENNKFSQNNYSSSFPQKSTPYSKYFYNLYKFFSFLIKITLTPHNYFFSTE